MKSVINFYNFFKYDTRNIDSRIKAALILLLVITGHFSRCLDAKVDFNSEIRPILSRNCIGCHGPDEEDRKADLRLDNFEGVTADLGGYQAIVPGNPAESELYKRVTTSDLDDIMPPSESGHELTPSDIQKLKQWIEEGAEYAKHWSFVKTKRWDSPKSQKNPSWARNDIDGFVLAKLEKVDLQPMPEAERHALARRLAFDLTGLPPTLDELDHFINDPNDGAYERYVDHLMSKQSYGERWAAMWLDIARYADSMGYGSDPLRSIWGYRDWVIKAYNDNMPFDQFTTEQIAGDLLPNPTRNQIIATAFHRNTMTNTEGGTDDEEFRVLAIKDRVKTTLQAWMGLTVGCAECHTHKFDPVSHEEYYQLYAIFNQTADADRKDEKPRIWIENPKYKDLKAQQKRQKTLSAKLEKLQKKIKSDKTDDARAMTQMDIDNIKEQLENLDKSPLPVMRELKPSKYRVTRIMARGNFLDLHEEVKPAVLKSFHKSETNAAINRLSLAKWLVDENNPLTARVIVNRYWAQIFGTGIVETEEDFGAQGELPSHPKLLDWLATEYVQSGWDTKRFLKLIVSSATYRQSSKITPKALELDPFNRYFSRGPRFRLKSEMVRDQALAISGLLCSKIGGPSVFPPQPKGMWRAAFNHSQREWKTSSGEDRYRRAMYTYWRRSVPYPSMAAFDSPTREICNLRRIRTNTPLQAFVTMNDPAYVEAAQAFARRIVTEGGNSLEQRIRFAYRACLMHSISPEEYSQLELLYKSQIEHFQKSPEDADLMASSILGKLPDSMNVPELAAWTVIANVLLNLDSILTK